jgi:hypothetical protein
MLLLSVATASFAESGPCGENLTWSLSGGTLTISGIGDMDNHLESHFPWYSKGSSITTVIIEDGVTSIAYAAFLSCSLTSVTIPESVTSIGIAAFGVCHSLISVTIPASVTSIGDVAFYGCLNLTAINVLKNNAAYASENGVLFNKAKTTLIQYPAGKPDTSYTIPLSVTSMISTAFEGCYSLTSITNPNPTPQTIVSTSGGPSGYFSTLYVPAGSKEVYEADPYWGQHFFNIIELSSNSHWQANYQQYPGNMTFAAIVILDDTELQSEHIEIGAFSNGECRGSVCLQHFPESALHPWLGFLTVHGNNDDVINLRIYDHYTGIEYEAGNLPFLFITDSICGNPTNPYHVTIFTPCTQTINLHEGWTWFSVNVANDNPSLIKQFKDSISPAGVLLKGRNEFIQTPGWIGTLSEISNETMYMVNTTAEQTLSFTGASVDPASVPIFLLNGWNWIGYTPDVTQTVGEAFAGINPQINDQIKSYSDYSVYTDQGWAGTLTQMTPGNGYKYFSNNTAVQMLMYSPFVQPSPTFFSNWKETVANQWTVAAHRYPNTMTVTAVVLQNNEELQSDRIEIGAFCNDECRGSVLLRNFPQIADHSSMGFLVVYGEGNEEIQLRVYDHATGEEYPVSGTSLAFITDAIHGTPAEPYRIATSPTDIRTVAADVVAIYLKQAGGSLQIQRPWESIDCIELLGLNGNTVLRQTGFTAKSIDVSSLANGVYMLKLTKDNQIYVKKFIKQ